MSPPGPKSESPEAGSDLSGADTTWTPAGFTVLQPRAVCGAHRGDPESWEKARSPSVNGGVGRMLCSPSNTWMSAGVLLRRQGGV